MTKMQWLKITVRDTAGFVFPKTQTITESLQVESGGRNNGDLMGLWWPGGGAFESLGGISPGGVSLPCRMVPTAGLRTGIQVGLRFPLFPVAPSVNVPTYLLASFHGTLDHGTTCCHNLTQGAEIKPSFPRSSSWVF